MQYDCGDKLKADTKEVGNNIIIKQQHRTVIPNFVTCLMCLDVVAQFGLLVSGFR